VVDVTPAWTATGSSDCRLEDRLSWPTRDHARPSTAARTMQPCPPPS